MDKNRIIAIKKVVTAYVTTLSLADWLEILLAYSADRTSPIFGDILKGCSRGDTTIRVAYGRVVDPSTSGANILLHSSIILFVSTLLRNLCAKWRRNFTLGSLQIYEKFR